MNGLGGNHSPLVRLRVQLLKHAPREKCREDGGQEEANKRIEIARWGLACITVYRSPQGTEENQGKLVMFHGNADNISARIA